MKTSFGELFKSYRLKAEISTLSEFGHLLAEKGFNYEDSIFSHWQSGSRVPQYRAVLLKVMEIFCERGAITTLEQANKLLLSAGQGNISDKEKERLQLRNTSQVFQVPNKITNFTGRDEIIEQLTVKENLVGKVLVVYGPAGVGKTVLAIELGHLLRDKFEDGVLWYKIEEDNIMDIFLSIARILGEDISGVSDLQVRGTIVRSLLASRNILLFLDSAELYPEVHLLIPNSKTCTIIITSQKSQLNTPIDNLKIELKAFSNDEVLALFKDVLVEKYSKISKNTLLRVGKSVGNLPLALHLLARGLLQRKISYSGNGSQLEDLTRENFNLNSTISMSYNKLDSQTKSVLVSASVFKGKDFSLDSIAYINGLSKTAILKILEMLTDLSLIEYSTKNRFRIHPAIKEFVRDKLDYPRSSYLSTIAIGIFLFFGLWWIILQLFVEQNTSLYYFFSGSYAVLALYGGVCGLHTSLKWGGVKTLLGKSVFIFSLGLLSQVFGQLVYSYYANVYSIRAPYPSIGDIGFFGTIPFYIYGAILLAKSSGIKINVNSFRKRIAALIIPVIMLIFGYTLYLQDYDFNWSNPIKIFLDFGYPLGEAISISFAIIIFIFSRNILDGIMKSKAFLILIALVAQFVADYVFLYDSNNFYSGNYMDFVYLISYFLMTWALLSLRSINIKVY